MDLLTGAPPIQAPARFREKAVLFGPTRGLVGVLTQPIEPRPDRPSVVLSNAGLVHRVGAGRLNVAIARRLAGAGFTVLRFDLSGFGDSRARDDRLEFDAASVKDTQDAMDLLGAAGDGRRSLLIGLCSGADLCLRTALADRRVAGALMIDSFAVLTPLFRVVSYAQRALRLESWGRLLRGDTDLYRTIQRAVVGLWSGAAPVTTPESPWVMPPRAQVIAAVRAIAERRVPLCFVYSGGPAYYNYLTCFRAAFEPLVRAHRLQVERFPEADHTFTLSHNQGQLIELVARWAESIPGRASGRVGGSTEWSDLAAS